MSLTIEIKVNESITQQIVNNLSSQYSTWLDNVVYLNRATDTVMIKEVDIVDDLGMVTKGLQHVVTHDKLVEAIGKVISNLPRFYECIAIDNVDAEVADVVMQYAIFDGINFA